MLKLKEELEENFRMYDEAIKDLKNFGPDQKAIEQLEQKRISAAQLLNLLPKDSPKKPYFCS